MKSKVVIPDNVKKEIQALEDQHAEIQSQIEKMPDDKKSAIRLAQVRVDTEINKVNDLMFSDAAFESDNRISESKRLERYAERYSVGTIFTYKNDLKIKTPFGNVIDAQQYVNVLQDQVIGTTSEVTKLNNQISKFNSLKFVDLIKLAFKRLLRRD